MTTSAVHPNNPEPGSALPVKDAQSLTNLENSIKGSHVPLRIIVWNQTLAADLRTFAVANPALALEVVPLPAH